AGPCGSGATVAAEDTRPDTGAAGTVKPELRRRGAGTAEPANA
ncbi:biotin synthase BioB, partial [Micrococcus luteus]|nr:biotin synthase BioB [Micrococcus luteus]